MAFVVVRVVVVVVVVVVVLVVVEGCGLGGCDVETGAYLLAGGHCRREGCIV